MKTYCIACGVFRKDLNEILPMLPDAPEVIYLEGGLHAEPALLRMELQKAIDRVPAETDRIILLYGSCGKGVVGLKSRNKTLIIPRVHDCISLFLGGTREYKKQFSHKPGTYYISPGWYEEQVQPRGRKKQAPGGMPKEYVDTLDGNVLTDRFGEDNSKAVKDFFDAWKKNYSRAVFIDTGGEGKEKYSAYAKGLADENGWEYTRLEGSRKLISKCFAPEPDAGDPELLIVPPFREIGFDSATGLINCASFKEEDEGAVRTVTFEGEGDSSGRERATLGLGIDAGGTYTDAVLFDFREKRILARSKAPTTKWKYSVGIMEAVRQLPEEELCRVDLVSLSTTLVTNAIIESNIHSVGLLLMPMGGLAPENLSHSPSAVIKGRMSIEGEVTEEIDRKEIEEIARKMKAQGVRSFAVSGYGASVNPAQELKVKSILRECTGLDVCCGHELSGTLNFYVRAHTAVLNAGVIPIMEDFLSEMKEALSEVSVKAPHLVVKGDGSVMTGAFASEFPVQTALSGPAASMAGARFLTGLDEALVIDVGGTTSDIGYLEDSEVSVCEEGASIGSWRTHVKAVDMLTTGLGGDSGIVFNRRVWEIGPGRITPFSFLNARHDLASSLEEAGRTPVQEESSVIYQYLYATDKKPDFEPTKQEKAVLEALRSGPRTIISLGRELCEGVWKLLKTERLEKEYCIQRAGLTPTDLYHLQGKLDLWPSNNTKRYFELVLGLQEEDGPAVLKRLNREISNKLGHSVLERIFPESEGLSDLSGPILRGGNSRLALTPRLTTPVVGLGAPAALVLEDAVNRLGGELHLPENGDVANALGAITSKVMINGEASIMPTTDGLYRVLTHKDMEDHEELEDAEKACLVLLVEEMRNKAARAGTSEQTVRIEIEDKTAESAGGDTLFLERMFRATLRGAPDLV